VESHYETVNAAQVDSWYVVVGVKVARGFRKLVRKFNKHEVSVLSI
jgi:hypothetical protein